MAKTPAPLPAHTYLDTAHAFFNRELFEGKLPRAHIHYHRHRNSYGYFSPERFVVAYEGNEPEATDEISINPMHVAERPAKKVLSTLVHEMCHQWQHRFGKRPTRCYHDKQFAEQMKVVGLQTSTTGAEGGKETGAKLSHYIIDGGRFDKACDAFMKANETVLIQDTAKMRSALGKLGKGDDDEGEGGEGKKAKSKGRIKFTCPGCDLNAWAKPSALLVCVPCKQALEPADGTKTEPTKATEEDDDA